MTLQLYFARRFLVTVLGVLGIFAGLIWLVDMIEYLRRFADIDFALGDAMRLASLNLPDLLYNIIPLIVVLATVAMFVRMARTSELIVTRAAGRSALRTLTSPVIVALFIGAFGITAFNPIVASTTRLYERTIAGHEGRTSNTLSISAEGLWLRQRDGEGQMVIQARDVELGARRLYGVSFLSFDKDARPTYRIIAENAELTPGAWEITNGKRWPLADARNPEAEAEVFETLRISSTLTEDQIRDSFAAPSTIPFWDLPAFIDRLESAGFSARTYRVWLQMELASPLFLAAMVLVGATFTLRHTRMGRTGLMVLFSVLFGFALYFLRSFSQVLGETGSIPIWIAAWAPPMVGISLSLALLLHLEDG